MVTKP